MDLIWYPHDALRNKSNTLTLEQIDSEAFRQIVSRMFLIMYRLGGVGLAGPQVGVNYNVFVGNPSGRQHHDSSAFVLINPEVIPVGTELVSMEEGCLSIPNIYAPVERPDKVYVKSLDVKGNEFDFEIDGFLSRIIQHELDHLNGVLFIDKISDESKKKIELQLQGHLTRVAATRKKREKQKRKRAKADAKKKAAKLKRKRK